MKLSTKLLVVLVALGTALPACANDAPPQNVTVTMNRMGPSPSGAYTYLTVTVNNDTDYVLASAQVECGFFSGKDLVSTDRTYIENTAARSKAFGTVSTITRGPRPDSAQCRISGVH